MRPGAPSWAQKCLAQARGPPWQETLAFLSQSKLSVLLRPLAWPACRAAARLAAQLPSRPPRADPDATRRRRPSPMRINPRPRRILAPAPISAGPLLAPPPDRPPLRGGLADCCFAPPAKPRCVRPGAATRVPPPWVQALTRVALCTPRRRFASPPALAQPRALAHRARGPRSAPTLRAPSARRRGRCHLLAAARRTAPMEARSGAACRQHGAARWP